jgi:hypothetical protein
MKRKEFCVLMPDSHNATCESGAPAACRLTVFGSISAHYPKIFGDYLGKVRSPPSKEGLLFTAIAEAPSAIRMRSISISVTSRHLLDELKARGRRDVHGPGELPTPEHFGCQFFLRG